MQRDILDLCSHGLSSCVVKCPLVTHDEVKSILMSSNILSVLSHHLGHHCHLSCLCNYGTHKEKLKFHPNV